MDIIRHRFSVPNVGKRERMASSVVGAALLGRGLQVRGWRGAVTALIGVNFLRRGITGFCYTYQALGVNTASHEKRTEPGTGLNVSVPHETGVRIDEAVTINLPREQVYSFWRDLGNLAEAMEHVSSVQSVGSDENQTRWIVQGPGGKSVRWDAQIVNEKQNELIAWRSLEGSDIPNAGSVHFNEAAGGRGTEVHVEILYSPPGGFTAAKISKLFGDDPAAQVRADLRRLKARLEAGVVPATSGQPAGAPEVAAKQEIPSHKDPVAKASEESFPASDAPAFTH